MKKITALLLALMLSFTLILLPSCGEDETTDSTESTAADPWDSATYKENTTLGTGAKTFTLQVCAYDKTVSFTVKTDKETVGEALSELNLIEGEDSAYGLYIKKVNGILADYDVDQTYWAVYINGEYAMSGIDTTNVENGATYKLSREK